MMEAQPRRPKRNLEMNERGQVRDKDTGESYDLSVVAAGIPWVDFKDLASGMPPHQYVVLGKCDDTDWDVLAFAIAKHPEGYRAYFRGYQSPMRYWELGDGYRYWPSAIRGVQMLNRCTLDSVEPPRRVDQGAKPICWQEWGALYYCQQGTGWTEEQKAKYPERFGNPAPPTCNHGEFKIGDRVTHRVSGRTGLVSAITPGQALPVYVHWDDGRKSFVGQAGVKGRCCC